MPKVLVTGATGFIGKHTLKLLKNKGYEVHAVSSRSTNSNDNQYFWHQANLLDAKQGAHLITKIAPTHLLHLAWHADPKKYKSRWTSSKNLLWVQSSLCLLESFKENGGKRALFAGTCAEYDWSYSKYSEVTTPKAPATFYGTCKHSLQLILNSLSHETGLSSAWGRIFFTFGPGEHPDRLVSFVIQSLLRKKITPCSRGDQLRDFLYVEDVASAFVSILESNVAGPVNIGSGKAVPIKELVNKICVKMGGHNLVRFGALPISPGDPQQLVADISKLTKKVGWTPRYDLDQGVEKTIHWWKKKLA